MNTAHTVSIPKLDANMALIEENERRFANRIAHRLIETPKLHVWMVLIPVIFVFHFFNLNKASKGRKLFVDNYLVTRRKTLQEVHDALEEQRPPDLETLAASKDVPDAIRHHYKAWLQTLIAHYTALLTAHGDSYDKLLKSAYRNHATCQEAIRKLNDAEMRFNSALKPLLPKESEDANSIIATMQETSVALRKEQLKNVFA